MRAALAIAAKDLRVCLRDRQTLIYAVILPTVMYPVLFWVLLQAQALIAGKRSAQELTLVAIVEDGQEARAQDVFAAIGFGDRTVEGDESDGTDGDATTAGSGDATLAPWLDESRGGELPAAVEVVNWEADFGLGVDPGVEAGSIAPWLRTTAGPAEAARALLGLDDPPDVVLVLGPPVAAATSLDGEGAEVDAGPDLADADLPDAGPADAGLDDAGLDTATSGLEVLFDGARARSTNGRDRLLALLEQAGEDARRDALEARGRTAADLTGLTYRSINLASSEDLGAFLASMMLPMMIVVMAFMGAFYPAIDLTAGERERGTEETTLLLPVPRTAVQLGKIMAVALIAGMASAMNLVGMAVAAGHLLGMLGKGQIDFQLDPASVVVVAPLVLIFVVMVSAVLTAVASFAETFKQGQSLMGAAQMVFIFPAMAATLPGLTLTPGIAAIPVVGAAIAFRTVLRTGELAELPWGGLALAALAMAFYSGLAVFVSVRLLNQELRTGGSVSVGQRLRSALSLGRGSA